MKLRLILAVCTILVGSHAQESTPAESPDEIRSMRMRILSPLEGRGIDIKNRSVLLERLRAAKGPDAAGCALALSLLPPDKLTVNELELAVTQGDDLVSYYAAWSLRRLGEKDWAEKGVERLSRFQFPPYKIAFGAELARAGRYDGWSDIEVALRSPKSGGEEFFQAMVATDQYLKMRDASGTPVVLTGLLSEILGAAEKAAAPASRLEQLRLKIQYLQTIKKP